MRGTLQAEHQTLYDFAYSYGGLNLSREEATTWAARKISAQLRGMVNG